MDNPHMVEVKGTESYNTSLNELQAALNQLGIINFTGYFSDLGDNYNLYSSDGIGDSEMRFASYAASDIRYAFSGVNKDIEDSWGTVSKFSSSIAFLVERMIADLVKNMQKFVVDSKMEETQLISIATVTNELTKEIENSLKSLMDEVYGLPR